MHFCTIFTYKCNKKLWKKRMREGLFISIDRLSFCQLLFSSGPRLGFYWGFHSGKLTIIFCPLFFIFNLSFLSMLFTHFPFISFHTFILAKHLKWNILYEFLTWFINDFLYDFHTNLFRLCLNVCFWRTYNKKIKNKKWQKIEIIILTKINIKHTCMRRNGLWVPLYRIPWEWMYGFPSIRLN